MAAPPGSASYFAQLSRDLMSLHEEQPVLQRVAGDAIQLVEACTAAVVSTETASATAGDVRGEPVLVVSLRSHEREVGSLRVHADGVTLDAEDAELVEVLAAHATNAIISAQTAQTLRDAVQSRHSIGVAQGILMQSRGLDLDQSHEVLRRHAEVQSLGVQATAEHVVAHGVLPGETDGVH